ncbi:MAG: thiolase family protein [Hydrogenophilaceae bacterium]|jgi:acetyl-CoA acetyltransferase|nr:thiolase family protein [Hydrogenophilaceae bacterium]
MKPRPRQAAIVGLYVTKQARRLEGRTELDLLMEAADGALADAALDARDVDGAAIAWPGPGGVPNEVGSWASYFKTPLAFTSEHWSDCAGARGILKAAAAIEAGLCDIVVLGSGTAGQFTSGSVGVGDGIEFADVYGSTAMAQFALVMRRYMHEYGVGPEPFAHVAATIRNHGHVNPEAVMYGAGPYTAADVLASPLIAAPLHRLECALVAEGACAIVLTTLERARDLPHAPVLVLGGGMEFHGAAYANPPLLREMGMMGQEAVKRTFSAAGATPRDVDVFCLYDAVAFEVVRQFEMLGFCRPGEGGAFTAGDRLTLQGDCPTNLDGGILSHSWIGTGQLTLKAIECARQLRGGCGARQVEGAELALATNAGAGARHIEMALFGRA